MPESFLINAHAFNCVVLPMQFVLVNIVNPISGGYCGRVPPLPIPNREVKPACADGTAMQCGRVGSRLLSNRELQNYSSEALFCVDERNTGETGRTGDASLTRSTRCSRTSSDSRFPRVSR